MMGRPRSSIHEVGGDYGESGIFLRQIVLPCAGAVHPGERHYFDHVSLVTQGKIRMDWRDEDDTTGSEDYDADTRWNVMFVKAGRWHTLTAIDGPAQSWCIFAMRDEKGKVELEPRTDHTDLHFAATLPRSQHVD